MKESAKGPIPLKGVWRTASATLGLLNIFHIIIHWKYNTEITILSPILDKRIFVLLSFVRKAYATLTPLILKRRGSTEVLCSKNNIVAKL